MNHFQIHTKNTTESTEVAVRLAELLRAGDLVILDGDLGTGKTFLVKAMVEALGSSDNVTSPTYTIANEYQSSNAKIMHLDAYRLSGIAEFRDTGLADFFPESIVFMEWGSKIIDEFDKYLHVQLDYLSNNSRTIHFTYRGKEWAERFHTLNQQLSSFQ